MVNRIDLFIARLERARARAEDILGGVICRLFLNGEGRVDWEIVSVCLFFFGLTVLSIAYMYMFANNLGM